MKKAFTILSLAISCFFFVKLSWSKKEGKKISHSNNNKILNSWYETKAGMFLQQLEALQKLHGSKKNIVAFEKQFIKTRLAFKQMEVLLSYFDPKIYQTLNGQIHPEVELEKGVFEYVQQPHGLQVIESFLADQMMFDSSYTAIQTELQMAIASANFLKQYPFTKPYTDTGFFNAIKEQTIRLAAMGITGFDKPVLDNGIEETAATLHGMAELLVAFGKKNTYPTIQKLLKQIKNAQQFATLHPAFNSFNRLGFIRNFLQPILASADKIMKQDLLQSNAPIFNSFFEEQYADKSYHQTKTYPTEMVALGQILFSSNTLSANKKLNCQSCHKPAFNFADTLQFNTGLTSSDTLSRNTPSLLNIKYHLHFQRDGHALFLQDQFREVMFNHVEMGNTSEAAFLQNVLADSMLTHYYKTVFGNAAVSTQNILTALESYILSLTDFNTPFDKYMRYETNQISPAIKRGFNLFMGAAKCGTCHFAPVFNGVIPPYFTQEENEVLGILAAFNLQKPVLDTDEGLYKLTGLDIHKNSFKVPTVRNLSNTFPYMHNGTLKNIDELIIFYNIGGGGGWRLRGNVPNQTLDKAPLMLSVKEQADLKAFLLSLN